MKMNYNDLLDKVFKLYGNALKESVFEVNFTKNVSSSEKPAILTQLGEIFRLVCNLTILGKHFWGYFAENLNMNFPFGSKNFF
jgi:hypothetical protein